MRSIILALTLSLLAAKAVAEERTGGLFDWVHGDWYLTLGAAGFVAPAYVGDDSYLFSGQPLISLGKAGTEARFTSRNDDISLSLYDAGSFRFGAAVALVYKRDDGTSDDLIGLAEVPFGGAAGVFAELYPTDWLRIRGELLYGIRSFDGLVGNVTADAFTDLTPVLRLSGGPRMSFGSSGYFDAYYGVTPEESLASGLATYDPGSGLNSVGAGGALTWKTTDRVTTSLYGEYARLLGPAADSSLVEERGSVNQFLVGVSATYRFDFRL